MTNTNNKSNWISGGDVSPEHGSHWIQYIREDLESGYLNCVRTNSIDDFYGALEIESGSIYLPETWKDLCSIIRTCGWDLNDINEMSQGSPKTLALIIAECAIGYGHFECGEDFSGRNSEILQIECDGKLESENGLKAKRYQLEGDLVGYIENVWLNA